jgi:diaphanous 1
LDRFAEQAALLNHLHVPILLCGLIATLMCSCSDDSWHLFMMRFANSVQHITGQELEVRAVSDSDSMGIVEHEMEALRTKVDELSDEVSDSISTLIVTRFTS